MSEEGKEKKTEQKPNTRRPRERRGNGVKLGHVDGRPVYCNRNCGNHCPLAKGKKITIKYIKDENGKLVDLACKSFERL